MKTNTTCFLLLVFLLAPVLSYAGWDAISPYPATGTDGALTFTLNGKAYVGGGLADNRLYELNATTGEWNRLGDIPGSGSHRAWAYSFSVNGKAYVAGGSYGTASELSKDLWEYDVSKDEWTQKADFPGGERDAGFSFSIDDKGYVGGGFDGQYLAQDLYSYEPAQDKWTKLADFPGGPVIFPVAFVLNGKAYVGTGGQGSDEIQDFWEYDPSDNSWTQVADFAGDKRQCAVAFTIGNKGYVGGGMSGYSTNRPDFWEYDPAQNGWTKVAGADFPTLSTAWSTGFALGGDVYFGLGVDFPDFTFSKEFYKRSFTTVSNVRAPSIQEKINLFPVPATNHLSLDLRAEMKLERVLVMDAKGVLCATFNEKEMDISALPAGIYFLRIYTNEGLFPARFTKQ